MNVWSLCRIPKWRLLQRKAHLHPFRTVTVGWERTSNHFSRSHSFSSKSNQQAFIDHLCTQGSALETKSPQETACDSLSSVSENMKQDNHMCLASFLFHFAVVYSVCVFRIQSCILLGLDEYK